MDRSRWKKDGDLRFLYDWMTCQTYCKPNWVRHYYRHRTLALVVLVGLGYVAITAYTWLQFKYNWGTVPIWAVIFPIYFALRFIGHNLYQLNNIPLKPNSTNEEYFKEFCNELEFTGLLERDFWQTYNQTFLHYRTILLLVLLYLLLDVAVIFAMFSKPDYLDHMFKMTGVINNFLFVLGSIVIVQGNFNVLESYGAFKYLPALENESMISHPIALGAFVLIIFAFITFIEALFFSSLSLNQFASIYFSNRLSLIGFAAFMIFFHYLRKQLFAYPEEQVFANPVLAES
jgi:hypothetical protein